MTDWYLVIFGTTAIMTCITWLVFSRFTMARIEKTLKINGHDVGFSWDSLGARAIIYAFVIIIGGKYAKNLEKIANVQLIKKHSTHFDWWLSLLFTITIYLWIGIIFYGILSDLFVYLSNI